MSEEHIPIRTERRPDCHVCGSPGERKYEALKDRLFRVEGEWNLSCCPKCGLLWLDPMPLEGDLTRLYENYYTHAASGDASGLRGRAKTAYWHRTWTQRKQAPIDRLLGSVVAAYPLLAAQADNMVFRLPVVENGRLLEVGCGNGEALDRLRSLGWDTFGIDFDPKAIAAAQQLGLKVEVGGLEDQSYSPELFDAIVMSHVLEHVPDPRALVREVWRVLAPGGTFVSITPNSGSALHTLFGEDWRGLEPPRHLHIFNVQSAEALMRGHSWDVAVHTTFANSHGIAWASSQLRDHDAYDMASRPDLPSAVRCRLLQAWTAASSKDRRTKGDELIILATKKPGATSERRPPGSD